MIAPYQAFPTADGWAMIGAGSDTLFRRLAGALDVPDLADDVRYRDNPSRVRHRGPLIEAISARTRQWKTADLIAAMRAAGVPSAPILAVDGALAEPQTHATGVLVDAPHPRIPDYRSIGLPIEWDAERPPVRRVPPALGEHSDDILIALGHSAADIRALRAQGVIA
jgi:crotonobetainyl-CoA:carnitine CoA-transferase CaiB-like acyl-CoA transferase